MATKTTLKERSRAAWNFISLIPSRSICHMLTIFLETASKFRKKKLSSCVVFTSSKKREVRKFHVVVLLQQPRNVQKRSSFCSSKLFLFSRFRCRRRRRCLKLPNDSISKTKWLSVLLTYWLFVATNKRLSGLTKWCPYQIMLWAQTQWLYEVQVLLTILLAPVVQKLDSAIHRINHYPADKYYVNQLRYPLDSNLSSGYRAIHLSNNWVLILMFASQ